MPPSAIENLVIYELHVGSLNPATLEAGTFADAIALIPYLSDLGVNAVELMPVLQFEQDLIKLMQQRPTLRSRSLDILYVHDQNRVLVFRRTHGAEQILVIASLNDAAFQQGYRIAIDARLDDGSWREVFNSDSAVYSGDNIGNYGSAIPSSGGVITPIIPAHAFLVLLKES